MLTALEFNVVYWYSFKFKVKTCVFSPVWHRHYLESLQEMEAPRRCWWHWMNNPCAVGSAERQDVDIIRWVHWPVCVQILLCFFNHVYMHFHFSLCVCKCFTQSLWPCVYVFWRWIPCHSQAGSWIGSGWAAASHHAEVQNYGTGQQHCWTLLCLGCQRKRHAACSSQGLKVRVRCLGQVEQTNKGKGNRWFIVCKLNNTYSMFLRLRSGLIKPERVDVCFLLHNSIETIPFL